MQQVFCIGLGGVGVSAVAKILLQQGVRVSGSDPVNSPLTADVVRLGGRHYLDQNANRITPDIDLVVATDDAPADHPQRVEAQRLGITIENFSVSLGKLMAAKTVRLCVAGTNGKSTTTALTGLLLAGAGLDPTVVVGSRVSEFAGNLRIGLGQVFVVEADEYQDHYLNYQPTVITLTNIEADHLDYFQTEIAMLASYKKFVSRLPPAGTLVANADDNIVQSIIDSLSPVVTFGFKPGADLRATDVVQSSGQQSWTTQWRGKSLGRLTIHLPGQFNIMNALAAMAGALTLGADPSIFHATIEKFYGIWRRFQILNPQSSITIVSDYAHHPTAVRATLTGARAFFPGRRIIAVFQPHHQSRLTTLFNDFVKSFDNADSVVIVETYTVPGRQVLEPESKTAQQLTTELNHRSIHATHLASPTEVTEQLKKMLQPGDVAIIMGAGDIWQSAEQLGKYYDR